MSGYDQPPSYANGAYAPPYPPLPPPPQYNLSDTSLVQVAANSNGLSLWLPNKRMFTPGELLVGKLRANFTKRITCRAVKLRFIGEVNVHWSVQRDKHRQHYHKRADLIPPTLYLLQGDQQTNFYLEPHRPYEWVVQVQLPVNVPGSVYWGREGTHISYAMKASIDIPNWPDFNLAYNVMMESSPIAVPPQMLTPHERKEAAPVNACCCFFSQGDAILHLLLPSTTLPYNEAQTLTPAEFPISIGIDNLSKRALGAITVSLAVEVWQSTGSSTHTQGFHVATCLLTPSLPPGQSLPLGVINFPPLLTQTTPTLDTHKHTPNVLQQPSVNALNLFKIDYFLEIRVENGCLASNLGMRVPLVVAPGLNGGMMMMLPPTQAQTQVQTYVQESVGVGVGVYETSAPSAPPMAMAVGVVEEEQHNTYSGKMEEVSQPASGYASAYGGPSNTHTQRETNANYGYPSSSPYARGGGNGNGGGGYASAPQQGRY